MIFPDFFFFFLAMPQGMGDLSSLTVDQTCALCIGRESLNHWTIREVHEGTKLSNAFILAS